MHNVLFSGGKFYLYDAVRSTFEGYKLFIFYTTQYFRGVNTIYTMRNVVFSGGKYYSYDALRSIFEG